MKTAIALLLLSAVLAVGATIPFNADKGLVLVPVSLDNRVTGMFGIDTGADGLYIDRQFALDHNLIDPDRSPQRLVAGISGSTAGVFTNLRSLAIGDERMYNLQAVVIDMNAVSNDAPGNHPDGLIGYEVLSRLYVTVDYPGQSIQLHVTRPPEIESGQCREVPFEIRKHLIVVEVGFPNGLKRPMILDYCASFTAVSPELAEELGLDGPAGSVHSVGTITLKGGVSTDNVRAVVTDLSEYAASVGSVSFDGILGGSFLYHHKFTVSYKQKRIYVHD